VFLVRWLGSALSPWLPEVIIEMLKYSSPHFILLLLFNTVQGCLCSRCPVLLMYGTLIGCVLGFVELVLHVCFLIEIGAPVSLLVAAIGYLVVYGVFIECGVVRRCVWLVSLVAVLSSMLGMLTGYCNEFCGSGHSLVLVFALGNLMFLLVVVVGIKGLIVGFIVVIMRLCFILGWCSTDGAIVLQVLVVAVGALMLFEPMHYAGLLGYSRRIPECVDVWLGSVYLGSCGGSILIVSILILTRLLCGSFDSCYISSFAFFWFL
jgi:hypothetical protein